MRRCRTGECVSSVSMSEEIGINVVEGITVPSTKIYWVVAPAARTPSIQAWFKETTRAFDGSSWNSLLQSKMTLLSLLN